MPFSGENDSSRQYDLMGEWKDVDKFQANMNVFAGFFQNMNSTSRERVKRDNGQQAKNEQTGKNS